MKKSQFFIFAIFVGVQSFLLQLIDQLIGTYLVTGGYRGFVFIAFQAWALYFLLGSNLKGAVKGFCGYIFGILSAIIMIILPGILPEMGILTVPLVALLVVPFMMCFEFAHWCINNVATFFVGAGAFFGIYNYVDEVKISEAAFVVLLYCILGLASGWTTICFRRWFEERIWVTEKRKAGQKNEQAG